MTSLREAAQQALEALGFSCPAPDPMSKHNAAESALRDALAQEEQEPVALFTKYGPPTMRDRDFWSAGYAAATDRAIKDALKEKNHG